jgi:hypothetical protein
MPCYRIADLGFSITCENSYINRRLSKFIFNSYLQPDIIVNIVEKESLVLPENDTISSEVQYLSWAHKVDKSGFYGYKTRLSTGELVDILDVDNKWTNANISLLKADYYKDYPINPIEATAFDLIGTVFRNRILFHDGIVIHASSLIYEEKGVVFSAPSGTGKSTHVRLWESNKGAIVINDDTPPIRFFEGKPYVFGSPWSGSSEKYTNAKAPLAAIFILEQASINSVEKLSQIDSITKLMPRMFLPYFNNELMEKAILIFEKILASVPIYLLKCRPDIEAMELAYKCVK